jgi:ribosome-associated protein
MEDMLPVTDDKAEVNALAELLRDHKGQSVSVLDLRKFQTWTDFFLIATVSSSTHMDGLVRYIKEYCRDREIEILGSSRKEPDDRWRLMDLGTIIIHLMTSDAREFYELERLWA